MATKQSLSLSLSPIYPPANREDNILFSLYRLLVGGGGVCRHLSLFSTPLPIFGPFFPPEKAFTVIKRPFRKRIINPCISLPCSPFACYLTLCPPGLSIPFADPAFLAFTFPRDPKPNARIQPQVRSDQLGSLQFPRRSVYIRNSFFGVCPCFSI